MPARKSRFLNSGGQQRRHLEGEPHHKGDDGDPKETSPDQGDQCDTLMAAFLRPSRHQDPTGQGVKLADSKVTKGPRAKWNHLDYESMPYSMDKVYI